jgi:PleD family two-component response regulator
MKNPRAPSRSAPPPDQMSATAATATAAEDEDLANPGAGELALHPRMKILVVDDEPLNVALLEDMLATSGYTRIRSLTDSREVISTCETFQPDLILLDIMMPHLDGFAILEALRSTPSDVFLPVIVLTADVNEQTKRRALRTGATDFLLKPFDELEVLLRIGNMLEIRRLHVRLDTQRAAFEEAVRERSSELRAAQAELEQNSLAAAS